MNVNLHVNFITRSIIGAAAAFVLTGCGGGSDSAAPPPPLPPPSALTYVSPSTAAVGFPIAALQPTVTGTVSSYSVSPALPAGLTLSSTSGVISGTPSVVAAPADYAVTASNSSGSTTFNLHLTVATVNVTSGNIARDVVAGTSIYVTVAMQPQYVTFPGTLYATASDASGVFLGPVTVTANGSGYALELSTSPTVAAGEHADHVTIALCSDAACTQKEPVPSVNVPFTVSALTPTSPWPGDHPTALSPWTNAPDWTMFQGNAAHTGMVPVDLNPDQFTTRWTKSITAMPGFNGNFDLATVTTSNGIAYLAGGNLLSAFNENDGSSVWQYDFSGLPFPSTNPPAVSAGVVYIAAGQQSSTYLFAFDATTGTQLFRSKMNSQWEHYLAPTIGPQGVYTAAGSYGGIYGFDTNGTQLFFDGFDQQDIWTPAADSTTVYSYTGFSLRVIDPLTGAVTSTIADPTFSNYIYAIGGSPVLGSAHSVFAAAYGNSLLNGGALGNHLLHFNTQSMTLDWSIAGVYPTTPAYDGGVAYVVNNNPLRLEARSETDGSLLWNWVPPASGDVAFKSEVLLTNNLVFVSTNLSTYAIDRATHHQAWSYPVTGSLALSKSGILYLEAASQLAAINVK
jgi:outer membrane protein assembly factor BamB